jgi:hypothetical protein
MRPFARDLRTADRRSDATAIGICAVCIISGCGSALPLAWTIAAGGFIAAPPALEAAAAALLIIAIAFGALCSSALIQAVRHRRLSPRRHR